MNFWFDEHFSHRIPVWLTREFQVNAVHVRDLGFASAKDTEIFEAARRASAIVITKDRDFRDLVDLRGPPPQVVLVSCGNTSNAALEELFRRVFPDLRTTLENGEALIEVR